MRSRLCLLTLLACFVFFSNAQTVSISSNDEVCLNELLPFQANITGSASTYAWDFGDNSTSTQKNPSHTYSVPGGVTVTLTVTFSGGGTVSASKAVVVHDLPTGDFVNENSNFCFFSQDVCLTDKSTMGSTTSGYSSRLILWGDGSQSTSSSPAVNKVTCYGSYPKPRTTPYTIIVEVKNDKGCEDKWQDDIYILEDYKPHFAYKRNGATCENQTVCFTNDSSVKRSDVQSFEWDFGDGSAANNSDWGGTCHTYTATGSYRASLKVKLKNGCESVYSRVFGINIYQFDVNVSIDDSIKCFPSNFIVSHTLISGGQYTWELYDTDTVFIKNAGFGIVQPVEVDFPEDYLLRLKLKVGNCMKFSRYFHLSSVGVSANFIPLNVQQCPAQDTVYFANTSKSHPSSNLSYFWNFEDPQAPACIGWKNNCNQDTLRDTKHFYTDTGCFKAKLVVTDTENGCISSTEKMVSIINPEFVKYDYHLKRPCIGLKNEYGVSFKNNLCDGNIKICYDSLLDDTRFDGIISDKKYISIADTLNGWVTVGFALKVGSDKVYLSADTSDFIINPANVCYDTTWFHNWFQLRPEPEFSLQLSTDTTCLPIEISLIYDGTQESTIKYLKYSWQPMNPLLIVSKESDTLPDISNIYDEEGLINIDARLEDSFGCYSQRIFKDFLGYHNTFQCDTLLCIGQEVQFFDSIRYYGELTSYWRLPSRDEEISWDLGDSEGLFTQTGPVPKHSYLSKGVYFVRMATKDRKGCTDTATRAVLVGGINAAIKDNSDEYLCDQIIQFFDSSFFDFNTSLDEITDFYWDFGDNSTESYLQNPFHYYSRNGSFTITLAVETAVGCLDTAEIPIYLKGPEPYFDILSDTVGCVPHSVTLKSTSTNVSTFNWYLGDDNNTTISSSNDSTLTFTYDKPGIYSIHLEGSDSFYNVNSQNTYTCSAVFPDSLTSDSVRRVVVLPIPSVRFDFEEPGCAGTPVIFKNNSDSIYKNLNWTLASFDTTTSDDLRYVFNKEGNYDVNFKPTYIPEGPYQRECFDSFSNSISVSGVEAAFTYVKLGLCSEFVFTDSSANAVKYSWSFDHPKSGSKNISSIPNPNHTYGKDSGNYSVCLKVENPEGCLDTFCSEVQVDYIKELKLYNVFTPNEDGVNDEFIMDAVNYKSYSLKIYNRWGEQIFSSIDPSVGWNGKKDNLGHKLPAATYFYVLKCHFNCERSEQLIEGIVELIRP
ncbi:PKD domain-containing protein [Bacteroidia bacterium]|nr:PKD domain-containing protein [Bacteroidia bacterium]